MPEIQHDGIAHLYMAEIKVPGNHGAKPLHGKHTIDWQTKQTEAGRTRSGISAPKVLMNSGRPFPVTDETSTMGHRPKNVPNEILDILSYQFEPVRFHHIGFGKHHEAMLDFQ